MDDFRASYRGTPRSVREARRSVIDYARICGFPSQATVDIAMAVGEALANAVEHGNRELGFIEVLCRFHDGTLMVEVADQGPGFDVTKVRGRRREPTSTRGFGITIMQALMDAVDYEHRGTVVRLRKRLVPLAKAGEEVVDREA